jgi:hypothetical protein
MKYRKLRIAWSVGWGMVALLLCVLWVRSFQTAHVFACPVTASKHASVWIDRGVVALSIKDHSSEDVRLLFRWHITYAPEPIPVTSGSWMFFRSKGGGWYQRVPFWLPLSILAAVATIPWLHWRFSLRTLLVATTVVCVLLGFVVWLSRS